MGLIVFITIILAFGCLPKKNTLENQNKKEEKTINDNNEEPIIIYESQGIFFEDYIDISFEGSLFTDKIEPDNAVDKYVDSMEPKDKNNTFVLLKTVFNNIGTEKINGEELPRATMIYNDEHRYDITVLTDEGDGSELNTYNFMMDIEPSLSRKIWYAAEIPKEIATESNFIVEIKIRNRIFHIILEELSYPDDNVTEQLDVKQKINAYMFWGDGCPHCENAHEFFKTIEKKYESCYKLVDYEVWNDKTSADLMKKVEGHFNEKNLGVPLIVIGNKHFMGYAPSYDEDIIEAIKKSCTSSNYVDIVSNIQNNK